MTDTPSSSSAAVSAEERWERATLEALSVSDRSGFYWAKKDVLVQEIRAAERAATARERERCAKVADAMAQETLPDDSEYDSGRFYALSVCARRIRSAPPQEPERAECEHEWVHPYGGVSWCKRCGMCPVCHGRGAPLSTTCPNCGSKPSSETPSTASAETRNRPAVGPLRFQPYDPACQYGASLSASPASAPKAEPAPTSPAGETLSGERVREIAKAAIAEEGYLEGARVKVLAIAAFDEEYEEETCGEAIGLIKARLSALESARSPAPDDGYVRVPRADVEKIVARWDGRDCPPAESVYPSYDVLRAALQSTPPTQQ